MSQSEAAAQAQQPQTRTVNLNDFIPICAGRMLTNGIPAGNKGKAVEIHHHLFDSLWNIGTRQIDASILLSSPNDEDQGEEEKKEEEDEESQTATSIGMAANTTIGGSATIQNEMQGVNIEESKLAAAAEDDN